MQKLVEQTKNERRRQLGSTDFSTVKGLASYFNFKAPGYGIREQSTISFRCTMIHGGGFLAVKEGGDGVVYFIVPQGWESNDVIGGLRALNEDKKVNLKVFFSDEGKTVAIPKGSQEEQTLDQDWEYEDTMIIDGSDAEHLLEHMSKVKIKRDQKTKLEILKDAEFTEDTVSFKLKIEFKEG